MFVWPVVKNKTIIYIIETIMKVVGAKRSISIFKYVVNKSFRNVLRPLSGCVDLPPGERDDGWITNMGNGTTLRTYF